MGIAIGWHDGRDHWFDDITQGAPDHAPTEAMPADAPFLLIYTSGTAGKPKGVVHNPIDLAPASDGDAGR